MKPTMSQVLHTSLMEAHDEALNEISNLKHDYEVVSIERNNLREHAERLAEALSNLIGKIEEMHGCMEVNYAEGNEECYPEFDVSREALAAWEAQK